jgi:RNA polymerase sigma-70 factor (TIGR02960 family)
MQDQFDELTRRHRRELHVHCYRMLASFDEAEDAVQEAFLRAWRGRDSFDGSDQYRAWLYRIATNVCLDMLRSRRSVPRLTSFAEVPWLQPYPDRLLDQVDAAAEVPSQEEVPEDAAIRRETVSLAFLAALQVLPPRQRAALIARDVLGWPASETADALGTSVAAANSALQRARITMQQHLPQSRSDWSAREPTAEEMALVTRFIDAHERCDTQAAMAIAAQDIRITMPPQPVCFTGQESITPMMARTAEMGTWRLLPVRANRMPGAASYLLRPGDTAYRAFKFDIFRIESGVIAEITTFDAKLFPEFGLEVTLSAD